MEAVGERMTPAVQMPNPAAGPREVSRPVQTGEKKPVPKPAGDRYAPEAPREPIGIYRAEKDGEGRTSIYISHRMSSCRFCDEIIVFQDGQIVEQGSHEELFAAGGCYAQMWNAQAKYYA